MNCGAVIFAQNNSAIDYVKMAAFAATRIDKFLKIPVTIITDSKSWLLKSQPGHVFEKIVEIPDSAAFHTRRFNDGSLSSKILDWKNLSRSQVYNLTPYDRTLVIDSDYVINSSVLAGALTHDANLQIYKDSLDISSWRTNKEYLRINPYSIPFYWATTFVFEKNPVMKTFFDLIEYVKLNWNYFRTLYSIESPTFRNDFAFSIAIHIMNGKTNGTFADELPGKMTYSTDRDILVTIDDTNLKFLVEKQDYLGEYTAAKTSGIDVHVMNKASLSRFIDGGTGV
jgi:hypothetical protein